MLRSVSLDGVGEDPEGVPRDPPQPPGMSVNVVSAIVAAMKVECRMVRGIVAEAAAESRGPAAQIPRAAAASR